MNLIRKDIIVISLSLLISGTASFFLYRDFTARLAHGSTQQIGTISFKKRIARRKYTRQVLWEELNTNSPLYNMDSIQTDNDSLSIIRLKDGSEIELDENTFIVLNWSKEGIEINFNRGSLSARKKGGESSKINIKSGTTSIDIKEGDVNLVKKKDKSLNISVSSGTATLKIGEEKKEIKQNERAVVTKETVKIEKIHIIPHIPAPDSYYVTFDRGKTISFKWSADKKGPVLLEVARDREFSDITASRTTASRVNAFLLPEGSYYWRLRSTEKSRGVSQVRKFTILRDRAAVPASPGVGAAFVRGSSNPMITFRWAPARYADSYIITLYRDADMRKAFRRLTSAQTSISTDELSEGSYYWSISQHYPFEGTAPVRVDVRRSFTIITRKKMPPPRLITPADGKRVSSLMLANEGLLCNWSQNSDASGYSLIVSRDKGFKDIVLREKTANNFYTLVRALKHGTYFWQVSARADGGRDVPSKGYRTFRVTSIEKLADLRPVTGSYFNPQDTSGQLLFSWRDPNRGGLYHIEIAKDNNFKQGVTSRYTERSSISVSSLPAGSYYWRVSLIDKKKKALVTSGVSRLTITARLAGPAAVYPVDQKRVDLTAKKRFSLVWRKVRGATLYRIKIYQFKGTAERPILSRETRGNRIDFDDFKLFDRGNFYWQIQAFQYKGGKVISQSSIKKFYFSISVQDPTEKPELITPNRIYIK